MSNYIADYTKYNFDLQYAIESILGDSGQNVSVTQKKKSLVKFGHNPAVGTSGRFTLWYTGQDQANETYAAGNVNSIDTLSSSSTSDTEVARVEGHVMTGGDRTFVVQTATLNGQNKVTLTTPLNRLTRIIHNNQSSTDLVGEVYGYENTAISSGKPSDTTKIHITIEAGKNGSDKAATSLSSTDFWIVTSYSGIYNEKSGSNIADVDLEVRPVGGVYRANAAPIIMKTGTTGVKEFKPFLIIPPNSDVKLTASSSATGQDIGGDIQGYLAKII